MLSTQNIFTVAFFGACVVVELVVMLTDGHHDDGDDDDDDGRLSGKDKMIRFAVIKGVPVSGLRWPYSNPPSLAVRVLRVEQAHVLRHAHLLRAAPSLGWPPTSALRARRREQKVSYSNPTVTLWVV